ncbi:MAG: sigma-70 family RNA polymerase sigma factor [Pseudonocardiaceae bacterium]
MSGPTLLATKLAPPLRRGLMHRRRLVDALDDAARHRLTLLVAPAGWGKTSLLADWHTAGRRDRVGWLALDPEDSDPVRFWTYLIAAVRTVLPGVGERALSTLGVRGRALLDAALPALINDLAALDEDVHLVLDDYHVLTDPELHRSVAYLLAHQPPRLHLVIAARHDPPLPVGRLRVHGEMLEIRSADLAFTDTEATTMLNGSLALGLEVADVERLSARTEGWAVLAAQPAELRTFMLETSVLSRLSAPLCQAVTGRADSAALLERIARSNLFLVPLDSDRQWMRYHRLFGELLHHELNVTDPKCLPELHRRAAAWFRAAGEVREAIDHALAAGDVGDAAKLIGGHWNAWFNAGRLPTVEAWLDRLPIPAQAPPRGPKRSSEPVRWGGSTVRTTVPRCQPILTRPHLTRVKPRRSTDLDVHLHQRGYMAVKDYQAPPSTTSDLDQYTRAQGERELVEALRCRDETVYRSLVNRYTPLMLRLARQHVPSQAIAEEVVQDTWVAVLRGIDAFQGRCQFATWLMRILLNTARKRGVREHTPVRWDALSVGDTPAESVAGPELSPEAMVLASETRDVLEQAIRTLPERQRAVLVLRDVDGCPAEEVCALLEVSTGNQRVLLHRARAAMRSTLHPRRQDLVPA